MSLNINRAVLVIFVIMLGIGGFYTIGQSQDKSTSEPRVTIIGDPGKLPLAIQRDLPTGYSWESEDSAKPMNSVATDEEDPTIIFLIDPGNPEINMKDQMEYARSMGKQEVFFVMQKERDPDVEMVPFEIDDVIKTIQGLDLYSIDINDLIFDFISTPAYAHSVQGSNCGGPTVPAGTCYSATFTDDDGSDGLTPGFQVCTTYVAYTCHTNSIFDHLKKNLAVSSTVSCSHTGSGGSPCPWVDCMKAHNGSSFIKAPVNLNINLYYNGSAITAPGAKCAGGNAGTICGCAGQPSLATPRVSINTEFNMNGQHSCNWIELMRHELAHTYGYSHGNFNSNTDNSKHCKNNHYIH